ncbi:Glycosyl hydrolase family 32 N-terminal domain protein [Serratia proteamaculans]|uniref:glycoside hydrolase family 32 protein n=1 Tax=Serratia proteamaculans TaxID=28151 RepID=UPI0009F7AACD|nr:glycoside hydrolase family 32 protein [Serratia proteamaculans]SMB43084.1 Glycosyl hydrolase family 32 N-terminal domain protein [Serratia proteamaculans]
MKNTFYKPKDGWVGDLIPFSHENKFWLFYLHDERKGKHEDDYGFGTTWNLLVTTDGTDIKDMGVILPTGGIDDIDLSCYTGCVLKGHDDKFHMFYTAVNCDNPKFCHDGKALQYVMHATSENLIDWEKHYDTAFGADGEIYEIYDWRDPFVYYSEIDKCYYMLLAARQQGSSQKNGGCIGLCKSTDLWNWTICPPYYDPQAYLTHECPDLFKIGDWWYLVYSTFSERFVTHYRMAKSPNGPWVAPAEDSFDGRGFYAAKTAEINGERWAFAWVPSRRGNNDYGQWEWGGQLVIHKLTQLPDGRLCVSIPPAVHQEFCNENSIVSSYDDFSVDAPFMLKGDYKKNILPLSNLPDRCIIEADISFSSGIRHFGIGIGIRQDDEYSDGYYFRLEPFYNRVVFDMWPRREKGINQWYVDGDKPFLIELERPYRLTDKRMVHICLLIDGDSCSLYVDNSVALTSRIYNLNGSNWSFFAFDGNIEVNNIKLMTT